MGVEEQKEEREVLDSIFPDEITDISDTAYRILITLEVQENDPEAPEPPAVVLNVNYPEAYPDVGPHLDLTSPNNAAKHPLFDVSEDKAQLLDALQPTIEESLGMAMVFTLVTTLKEAAEVLIADRQRQEEAVKEIAVQKREAEENRRFHGTMVTRDTFLAWRDKFRKEMEEKEKRRKEEEEAEEKKKKSARVDEKKLTGKQLWERGLAGRGDEDLEEKDIVAGVENFKVNE